MSDDDILSQEEIDALLSNVDDEVDNLENSESVDNDSNDSQTNDDVSLPNGRTVSDYFNQERIVRGQLPVMDRIHDRVIKVLMEEMYALMAREVNIKQNAMKITKYKEFISTLNAPSMINIFRYKPLRGNTLIIFDSTLVFNLVDNYFGGGGQFNSQIDRLDFTMTEIRIVNIFINKLVKIIEDSWAKLVDLNLVKLGEETNPQLVNIIKDTDLMLVNKFEVDFENPSGSFYIIIPYLTVEPIKQQLELGAPKGDEEIDQNWTNLLLEELMDVKLLVSSTLGEANLSLSMVNNLKSGDFIPLKVNDTVTLDIEGVPLYKASVGSTDDKSAIKIIEKINY